MKDNRIILFFDSNCLMCNSFVQFLYNNDKTKIMFYATLNSELAKQNNISVNSNSMVLLLKGNKFEKTKAFIEVLRIIQKLPFLQV